MNLKLLNSLKAFVVEFSTKNGINLQDEFGTVDAFNNWLVAVAVTALVEQGKDIETAYDIVMGDGAFRKMADDVWAINNPVQA